MAAFIKSEGLTGTVFHGKWTFLDTNFLSVLSYDLDALTDFRELTLQGARLIDPNVRFEFLRSVFTPERRLLLEQFVGDDDVFLLAPDHHTIGQNLRENALTLSYLYAQNGSKDASLVDLMLASRALLHGPEKVLIVTQNRKDFPNVLFDTVGVLNYEKERSNKIDAYAVLSLSLPKYYTAVDKWRNLSSDK